MSKDYYARVRIKGEIEIEAELGHSTLMSHAEKVGISQLLNSVVKKYIELTTPPVITSSITPITVNIPESGS